LIGGNSFFRKSIMFNNNLPLILTVWMLVIFVMAIVRTRKHMAGVGLVLAFVLNLWLIHWAASLIYILPWYMKDPTFTVLGAEQSLYAILAFAFGSLALTPVLLDIGILARATGIHHPDSRLPKTYLLIGGVFYVLASTVLAKIPTLSSVIGAGQELAVVGLGLCWWQAWRGRKRLKMDFWLAVSLLPPLLTVITRGFIGYGAIATLSVLIFISNFIRPRIKVVVVGLLLGYMALSVYVTYMRDRGAIRETVWGGQSLSERFDRLVETSRTFEWFDPYNQQHLQRIDGRLNQSYLVGVAVARLNETGAFMNGRTLSDAALSLVPRILWPDKPITAGSGKLVNELTGIRFDGGTSVGIGQVMEFYGNFGTTGVVIGFMIIGLIVTTLDILATERLASGDLHGFVLCFLPGLAFLQVGGQLVEVTASAGASIVVALVVNRFLDRLQNKQGDHSEVDAVAIPMRQNI
jgi:hypothetical protein